MVKIPGIEILNRYYLLFILIFVLFTGCITTEKSLNTSTVPQIASQTPFASPVPAWTAPEATIQPTLVVQKLDEKPNASQYTNNSVAVEVNYRAYVDWFKNYNLNIRSYTPQEYICGQYTADMINASEKAGYKAYFAAVTFSDGSGHAIVSFKSTVLGFTSWYFFEPQTNNLMTPEILGQQLERSMGKKVVEVNVYGYFDDAGDKDPSTWRFAYTLFNEKY